MLKHLHPLWRFDVHLVSLRYDKLHRVYHSYDEKVWVDAESGSQPEKTS